MTLSKKLDKLAERHCKMALQYPADEVFLLSTMQVLAVEATAIYAAYLDRAIDNSANTGREHEEARSADFNEICGRR
jgi:hypothetical protein